MGHKKGLRWRTKKDVIYNFQLFNKWNKWKKISIHVTNTCTILTEEAWKLMLRESIQRTSNNLALQFSTGSYFSNEFCLS